MREKERTFCSILTMSRFWRHVFDQPGEQTDEAVSCVLKAFKWRKEFGVESISEDSINMTVVNKGFLFSHGRDKVCSKDIF